MRIPVFCLFTLTILGLSLLAAAPAGPATITGTIGKSETRAETITVLGRSGVLFVRSEARWTQLQKLLDGITVTPDTPFPNVDFSKQNIVLLYKVYCRAGDSLSLNKFDSAATRPTLEFSLRWDGGPTTQPELLIAKFILAIIPVTPAVQVTLSSERIDVDHSPKVNEFSAALGGDDGGDIVDGLQAVVSPKVASIKPGEDMVINFELHTARMPEAKPDRFGALTDTLYVWDGVCSKGYRNYGIFVTTPDGKTALLQRKEITAWDDNAPRPVAVTPNQPYNLSYRGDKANPISLKILGFDTSAPGTYTITGLYSEQGGSQPNGNQPITLWGGSIASNTIAVEVKN